jgi:rRNA-processing protein FCF1
MTEAPELDYYAICIDTNIFREAGYAFDKGLPAQLTQFADSPVQVVISEVVHREMKRHLADNIGKARASLEKGLREVQQEMLASEGAASRARKAILTGENDAEIAQRRLDAFYESCGATVLAADSATSREVLERYFNQQPPFAATGDKKKEFPDAYALISVEKWAEEHDFKVLMVSQDKGWREFCERTERLVYRNDLGSALQLFQPHNAASQLLTELNASLLSESDTTGIEGAITDGIKASIEAMEIDVNADSRFYWLPSEVYAEYKSHEFRHLAETQVDIDLVRVTEREVVVRIPAEIVCDVHASFSLSMTDPIDKDEVDMGSQSLQVEQTFDSDVLITFEGDFSRGLTGVTVEGVELVEAMPTVEFGEIELSADEADYHQYLEDMAMDRRDPSQPS